MPLGRRFRVFCLPPAFSAISAFSVECLPRGIQHYSTWGFFLFNWGVSYSIRVRGQSPFFRGLLEVGRRYSQELTFGTGDLIIPLMGGRFGKYGEAKRLGRLRKGRKEARRVQQHDGDSMRKERSLRKRFGRIKPEELSKER
jgi:hypothetical protein